MTPPFLSIYTPSLPLRTLQREACIASVAVQTLSWSIQHVIEVDYHTLGVAGMFARVAAYPPRFVGEYVTWLCDDDVLADEAIVERLYREIQAAGRPPVCVVSTEKGEHGRLPSSPGVEPVLGRWDLNCLVVRRDVWERHLGALLPACYESDFQWMRAIYAAGHPFHDARHLLLSRGAVSRGALA